MKKSHTVILTFTVLAVLSVGLGVFLYFYFRKRKHSKCTTDANCQPGYKCDNGSCVQIVPECRQNSDCPPGYNCVDDKCVKVGPPPVVCSKNRYNFYITPNSMYVINKFSGQALASNVVGTAIKWYMEPLKSAPGLKLVRYPNSQMFYISSFGAGKRIWLGMNTATGSLISSAFPTPPQDVGFVWVYDTSCGGIIHSGSSSERRRLTVDENGTLMTEIVKSKQLTNRDVWIITSDKDKYQEL